METVTYYRPTKLNIDLKAIKQNVENLKRHINPGVQIIAVVKANAYGHGDVEVAKAALAAGATMLAVATPDEAVHIRQHIEEVGMLVLGASPIHFATYAAEHNISLTVFSAEWINQVSEQHLPKPLKVHIKVDSGMGRIGVTEEVQFIEVYEKIKQSSNIELEGMFTHFATADEEDTTYFENQINKFKQMLNLCTEKPKLVHVANTATALIKDQETHFDAVRYGISLYGLAPSDYVNEMLPFKLHPALSFETELVHVKLLKKGEAVGYGSTFIADGDCYVGTLPVGYADGMIRKLSGQEVLVAGQRAPIIGRICMDQCMVKLPTRISVGEKVMLIGKQGDDEITLDDWARKLDTINYEVPCIITSRVPRIYK
jgi:alanine racemase